MSVAKISIVIPNFNYGMFLGSAIDSVLRQTFPDFEIFVIDNFSTDNSAEIVSSFDDERIQFVKFDNGGSIASARNMGASLSSGEYLAFLDADDYWHPKKLITQLEAMGGMADVSYHDMRVVGGTIWSKVKAWSVGRNPLATLVAGGNPIVTSSAMVRKSAFVKAGGFPEDLELVAVEDFALWLRMAERNARFRHINKVLGFYRVHPSVSASVDTAGRVCTLLGSYFSKLELKSVEKSKGFIAYARGVQLADKGDKDGSQREFLFATKFAVKRFKWRAATRLALSLLGLNIQKGFGGRTICKFPKGSSRNQG